MAMQGALSWSHVPVVEHRKRFEVTFCWSLFILLEPLVGRKYRITGARVSCVRLSGPFYVHLYIYIICMRNRLKPSPPSSLSSWFFSSKGEAKAVSAENRDEFSRRCACFEKRGVQLERAKGEWTFFLTTEGSFNQVELHWADYHFLVYKGVVFRLIFNI